MEPRDLDPKRELNVAEWVDHEMASLGHEEWQPDLHRGLALLRAPSGTTGSRRRWTWAAAAVLATCFSLMAMPGPRAFAERCVSACVSGTGWIRELLAGGASGPTPSNVYVKPGNRTMAPDFALEDASGQPVRLSQLRGNVVLVNFWATWCAPCRVEIPMLLGFEKTYRDRNFKILGIALDDGGWSLVRPYADARNISYPILLGNQGIADLFGLKAVPTTFVIDRQGRIAATHIGLCQKSEYEGDIKAVLNERITP
ncbi:MAG: TlpA family protein disulfide reductase [Acidobacteriia bacterium]|nr:TlpA family protein disulfide reductase [Terriglobia bacterium]